MVLKDFAVALICLFMLLPKGNAANISQIIVHAGQTADIYYRRSANETSEGFQLYRARKDMVAFSVIADGSNMGTCTDGDLKMFCTEKTAFSKYNESHLLLKIKETVLNDTGSYEVLAVFKGLDGNFIEQILLKVTLKIHAYSTKAPPAVNSASFPCTFSMALLLLLFLLFAVIQLDIN